MPAGINSLISIVGTPAVTVRPFRVRFELEPYFEAATSPGGVCDGCGSRRPDLTLHFRVADSGIFRFGEPAVAIDHDDITGCGCDSFTLASCALGCGGVNHDVDLGCTSFSGGCPGASPLIFGETHIENFEDVPAALQSVVDAFAPNLEQPLDTGMWFATSEVGVGGLLLGRLPAVRALIDRADVTCDPSAIGGQCVVSGTEGRAYGADCIESLRVRGGAADLVIRENPPL